MAKARVNKPGPKPKPKKRERSQAPAKGEDVSLSEREQLLSDMRDECRAQLSIVTNRRLELEKSPGSFDPQLTGATNTLAKSVAVLSAEGRQLDKHRITVVATLTPEEEDALVVDFLGDVSPARREAFRKFLNAESESDLLLGHG